MTQAKQKDKIQEIMGLVTQHAYIYYSAAIGGCRDSDDVKESECAIESKLRELVREPLDGDDLSDVIMSFDGYITGDVVEFVEHVERAHNITSASGEV